MADQENTSLEQTTAPELSPVEQKAVEAGWVPKEQWDGDPEQWRPAKEFLDRGELFKKIEDQKRTMQDMKRALDELKSHHSKVRETEYARALQALKAQKKAALEEGDADAVIQLDDQIDLVKDEQRRLAAAPKTTVADEVNPVFASWVEKNSWYENNQPMRAYADALGRDLAMKGMSPSDVLKEVEKQVKAEFPNKFVNPNRSKPGAVENSTGSSGKSGDSFAMSDDERRVMQRFVRTGVMSEKEYIAELKRVKGVN